MMSYKGLSIYYQFLQRQHKWQLGVGQRYIRLFFPGRDYNHWAWEGD